MNVKEFISSGIIESYILGLCTEADRREVESACEHYPEIAKAKKEVEEKIEQLLLKEQIAPPAALKEKILSHTNNEQTSSEASAEEYEATPMYRSGIWKWVAAASIILLAGSIFWIFQLKKENNELATTTNVDDSSRYALSEAKAELAELKSAMQALQSPGLKMASLNSTPTGQGAKASIFWDTTTKEVFLILNNLPEAASDKQYQLWALINKQPVDLGVLDQQTVIQKRLLIKMKNVQNAEAFAITLEPNGGSTQPTMQNMYVYGKL